jgi:hypothetical protein
MIDDPARYLSRQFLLEIDLRSFSVRGVGRMHAEGGRRYALAGVAEAGLEGLQRTYRRHGELLTGALLGQYSAAVVDAQKRIVVLAQSSLGLGRAYWWQGEDRLLLSSDLLLIAAQAGVQAPDPDYFARMLAHRPCMEKTPFSGIAQLDFGVTLVFGARGRRRLRPWQPSDTQTSGDPEKRLRGHLDEAVRFYLPESGGVIAEISGGTDSSLVAAVARANDAAMHGLSYVSARGTTGEDAQFAHMVCSHLRIACTRLDADRHGMSRRLAALPDQPGRCRYLDLLDDARRVFSATRATRLMTGVGGDVVFDYKGLVPVFLADPLVALRPITSYRLARRYARERGGVRSASHFLRYVGLPWAIAFMTRRNLAEHPDHRCPSWLSADLKAALRGQAARLPRLAPAVRRPSARYLWDQLFVIAALENDNPDYGPDVEVVHPLLHRPLVEFMLALDTPTRRGIPGDRRLQRRVMRRLLPDAVTDRTGKGSSQMLREQHVQEATEFLSRIRTDAQLLRRGWVDPERWRRAVDLAAVGASPEFPQFAAALEAELWLQALDEHGIPAPLRTVPLD